MAPQMHAHRDVPCAQVTLKPSQSIRFVPHPIHDPLEHPSLEALVSLLSTQGFYGSQRLLMVRRRPDQVHLGMCACMQALQVHEL